MSSREWLEGISAQMPVCPPFTLGAVDVRVGGNISRGPDHEIVGGELVVTDLADGGRELRRLGPFTAAQMRALGQALLAGADEVDRRTWFRGEEGEGGRDTLGPATLTVPASPERACEVRPCEVCASGPCPCGCGGSEAAAALAGCAELDGCGS